jgi:hypothetical protein
MASATRAGMLAHAGYLLADGFTVLIPDSRGHGSSGGDIIAYGTREASDVHVWADWFVLQSGFLCARGAYGIDQFNSHQ